MLVIPASSFVVNSGTGIAGKSVSVSSDLSLSMDAKFDQNLVLDKGTASSSSSGSGNGSNSVTQTISGNGYSLESSMSGDGKFSLSSDMSGDSDSGISVQDSTVSGSYGEIAVIADSTENTVMSIGGYDGQESGSASQSTVAIATKDGSVVSGSANLMGIEVLGEEESEELDGSTDIGAMSVNMLTEYGSSGYAFVNSKKGVRSTVNELLTGPDLSTDGGRSSAYVLTGYRWNTKDPQIKLTLKNDANLTGEGLSVSSASSAIAAAANTWDDATNQNLFADSNLVTVSSTVLSDKRDKSNTLAWKYLSTAPSALAYARTWYSSTKVDGYYTVVESDISFNTKYSWKTDGTSGYYDVQSIALHELGHTIGLSDLYGLTQFKTDTRQAMHYYTGIKRTLGNGDKTGVWMMYDSGLNKTMAAKGFPA